MKVYNRQTLDREIKRAIKENGDEVDLNYIDVSHIKYFSFLFDGKRAFNGKIDKWNFKSAKCTRFMFNNCPKFNQKVDLSAAVNLEDTSLMFRNCKGMSKENREFNESQLIVRKIDRC